MEKLFLYTKIWLIAVILIGIQAESSLDWDGIFGENYKTSDGDDRAVKFGGGVDNDPFDEHIATSNEAINSRERLSKDSPVSSETKFVRRRSKWFFHLRRRKPPYYLNPSRRQNIRKKNLTS